MAELVFSDHDAYTHAIRHDFALTDCLRLVLSNQQLIEVDSHAPRVLSIKLPAKKLEQ